MKISNLIISLSVTIFFFSCSENKKKLEVKDILLEKTVSHIPPPPPPPYDTTEIKKHFNDYTKFKKSGPETVYAPATKPSIPNLKDPAFLVINIQEEKYAISFLNKKVLANNISDLKTFLQKNKSKINKDKVFVAGFNNSETQKRFMKLLSNYGITKFRVTPPR